MSLLLSNSLTTIGNRGTKEGKPFEFFTIVYVVSCELLASDCPRLSYLILGSPFFFVDSGNAGLINANPVRCKLGVRLWPVGAGKGGRPAPAESLPSVGDSRYLVELPYRLRMH